jgi:hypothetical protein
MPVWVSTRVYKFDRICQNLPDSVVTGHLKFATDHPKISTIHPKFRFGHVRIFSPQRIFKPWLPPNTPHRDGPAHHHVHHPLQLFLLRENVVQTKEHRDHISMVYAVLLQGANRAQPRGLCQRHRRRVPKGQKPHRRPLSNIQQLQVVQH